MKPSTMIVTELERVKKELHDAKEDHAMKDHIIAQLKQIVELKASTQNCHSSNMICESSFLKVILFVIVVL